MFNVRFIDQEIAENAIDIRKQYRIKLPDAIIAATANTDDLCLVTRNIEDFKNIAVKILNPFDYESPDPITEGAPDIGVP